ncbi:hypothetical protein JF546_08500 [Nitratireductor aquimarinus]|uniref:DUF5801 repeats-in-toxin domain-containing protein n=1 Tax=Nitratireductor aquimarinus TaxID=889300 RepID=UPI001A9010EA|nr:DUF5801 repeats-in-toxin domain-containing protein [Nitratireductor aquimarinus]MBN8243045.1 hypothetical protein [Nitratireductor aquimarinus]MBY6130946.1 hypothetical protein [Nitratireductor aquimarinus]MCA1302298.1 DUF5801 domain-containing protein [Nitratireductor aquimarinus]
MANNDRTNTTDERATAAEQSSTSTRLSQAEQNALQFAQNETAAEPTPVDPATGQPVAEPTSQAAVPDVPETITPDADNVVRLPQGVSIDEIRLDGNNLVLVQPDGSTVTILNAALKVPTFLIGDVEIPELALAAALQANGIDVAAGPDGALTVVSAASQSGGGGFNTPNGDIGDAGPVIDLLPPTALQFGTLERRELFPSIRENDFPELSIVSLGAPPGQVNESALASGSGGGTTSTLGNILVDPGDDGLGSLVVTNASGVSVDVTNGGSIQGVYGELIVTPNGDGTYSFEYVLTTNTIDHDNAGQTGADDVVTDTFDFVVTDGNGDTASDELTVTITDDGPAIDLAPAEESEIVLDETDNDADDGDVGGLLADLTVPGSALFTETATPGADGEQSKVYSLVLNAGATGLTDTLSGEPVVLSEEGGAIVGRTETGGDEVFRISVDANTGDITVSQSRALFHDQNPGSDAEAHDESLTPEVMNSGLVSLNVVLTDGDGDTASDTAELGALIKFQDDGPVLGDVTAVATGALTLDESPLPGAGDGVAIQTLALAGNFAAVNYGTDGAGTTTYGFALSGAGVPVASGLYALNSVDGTFTQGTEITLSLSADGQTITGSADGVDYFTIAVDDTGTVTFTQLNNIWHGDAGDADDAEALSLAAGTLVLQQTVTDQDGDSVTADLDLSGGVFEIEDDGPTNNTDTASETVHEDALNNYDPLAVLPGIRGSTGNNEGGKTTTAVFTYATIASLVSFGSDGAGAVALNTDPSLEGTAIAGVTSQGDTLAWHVDGNVIQGVASDGRVVFTITKTAGTGTTDPTDDEFTFELLDQVDHIPLNTPSGDEDASAVIDISNAFRAFDGDGDSIVLDAGLSVAVENDVPVVFVPEHAYVANLGAGPATFDLNFEQAVGADEFGSVRFINITTGVTQLRDAGGELVTSGGEPITLVLNAGGTALTGYVNYGEVGQTQVLTVTINPDDTYTVDLDAPLDDGTVMATFNPYTQGDNPGNYLFNEVNDLPLQGAPVLLDVLISGTNGSGNLSSANVSQSGTGVGSQSISQDATLRLDFAEEFVRSNIGPNSGNFTVSNTQLVTSVAVKITQTGSNDPAVAYVEALNTNFAFSNNIFNSNQAPDVSNFLSESKVAITAVVLNGVEYDVGDYANGALLDATHRVYYVTSGSDVVGVYVTELNVGDTVGVATSDGFSRFAITNGEGDSIPGGGGTFDAKDYGNFDIGDVSFRTDGQEGQPIDLSLDVRGTDYDGDTVDSTLDFTVVPNDAHHIVGTSGDDMGANALEGTTGDDLLAGLAGNDVLYGFGGNDLPIGGEGADTLYGGIGENTYDLTDTDGAIDTVVLDPSALTGMNPDEIIGFSSEDVVDLTELVSLSTTSGENVGDFVRLNPGDGKELQVDADGTAGGDDWVTVATFDVPQTPASIKILYDDDGSDTSGTV